MANPPSQQHVVSQVVTRRWVRPPGSDVSVLDLRSGSVKRKGPRGVAWEPNFIAHDAAAAEQLWKEVEDRLPHACAVIDSGATTLPPDEADVVKDCVALHWARSRAIQAASRRVLEQVREEHVRRLAGQPEVLDRVFRESTGLVPAGAQARLIALESLAEGPPELRDGRHFAQRVLHFFAKACDKFRSARVEIIDAPPGWEFVLGDSPVLTLRGTTPGVGPQDGVALGDARHVIMPLGPDVAIALDHYRDSRGTATIDQIRMINQAQVAGALRQVAFRPGSPVESAVRRWAAQRPGVSTRRVRTP